MSYLSRVYRQRNPHTYDEANQEPFFSKRPDINNSGKKNAFFQAKLTVNEPGDKYEQEADSVARAVVNNNTTPVLHPKNMSTIQHKSVAPGKAELNGTPKKDVFIKEKKKQALVQTKQDAIASTNFPQVTSKVENSSGKGNALPKEAIHEMSSSFGVDLSSVRVHHDPEAAEMNNSLGAQAFTHSNDIYFNSGKYNLANPEGKLLLAHELIHVIQQHEGSGNNLTLQRQIAEGPGNSDPCFDLLQQIIELLNEVAKRFNDALNDPHELFKYHKRIQDAHPDYGSWDGHRDRFNYDRDRLRHKLAEWESNDDCRGYPLTNEQENDLKEAEEFKVKEFPARPAPALSTTKEEEPSFREKIANGLKKAGIPAWAVAGFVVLVAAALLDPEPFTKVVLLIGVAAAIVLFIAIGRQSEIPSSAAATASISSSDKEDAEAENGQFGNLLELEQPSEEDQFS